MEIHAIRRFFTDSLDMFKLIQPTGADDDETYTTSSSGYGDNSRKLQRFR